MNLSTYAKITYALGEMYLQSGKRVDLDDLMQFKFPDTINAEMAKKVVDLVNSMEGMRDFTAVLPGSTVEISPFSLEKPSLPSTTRRLGSDNEDSPEEEPTRPR